MTVPAINLPRPLAGGLAIVVIGVLIGLVTVLAVPLFRPVILAFALGALALLVLALVVPDRKAYWMFLLVLSMLFDIGKRLTTGIVDPWEIMQVSGPPSSGLFSFDLYPTDIILLMMVLPWVVRLCLRRESLYFPKFGYLFLLYLAWALIASMIAAQSFDLSMFEWCRQAVYFLYFVYIINNISTRSELRAVILALLIGLVIEAGSVIGFFEAQIGTETKAFSGLYRQTEHQVAPSIHYEAEAGKGKYTKRSAGTFGHPSQAAYYFEFTMPIALACFMMAQRFAFRLLFGAIYATGFVAIYLTFARSGLVGLICGVIVIFAVARRGRLVSQQIFTRYLAIFVTFFALSAPLLINSLLARPEAATYRLELLGDSFQTYWQRPLTGLGLAAVMIDARKKTGNEVRYQTIHNQYLVVLTEVGPLGFLLFYAFFWQIAKTAFRCIRAAEAEMKLLLVGIMGALASITVHSLGDGFDSHTNYSLIMLYVGLIVAIARRVQAERASA